MNRPPLSNWLKVAVPVLALGYGYKQYSLHQTLKGDFYDGKYISLIILREWLDGKHVLTEDQYQQALKFYTRENYTLGDCWPVQWRCRHNQAMWKLIHENRGKQELPLIFDPYKNYSEDMCKEFDNLQEEWSHNVSTSNLLADWPDEVFHDAIKTILEENEKIVE